MKHWVGWVVLAMVVLSPQDTEAQVRARVAADTTEMTLGDRIGYEITVEHPVGTQVAWPDSLDLSPFEVLSAQVGSATGPDGGQLSTLRLSLTVFDLGDVQIPSVDLDVVAGDGATTPVSTNAFGISVVSVGLDEGDQIRDIKGPIAIPVGVVSLLPWLILLALLGATVWWLIRRRGRGEAKPARRVEIPDPPHVMAYRALDRLLASDLLVRGEVKAFHVTGSEIIRTYIEGRYEILALEMTSREVLMALSRVGIEGDVREGFQRFFEHCDLVKFAKLRPSSDESTAVVELARTLVDQTRPRFEPPSPEQDDEPPAEEGAKTEDPDPESHSTDQAESEVLTPATSGGE